jgi:hypothetical protein
MQIFYRVSIFFGAAFFSAIGGNAWADGLSDLKTALVRLQGQTPIKAALEVKTTRRQGEGKEAEESTGQVSVSLEDGARGMQVLYSKDVLGRAESEARAKAKDSRSKTPTVMGLSELGTAEVRPMMAPVAGLLRQVEEGSFIGERLDTYNGKPARLLSFEFGIDKLTERERKYVKKLESTLELWIAADGTPLASRHRWIGSGRAFLVVSFEQRVDEDSVFGLVGDRLLTLRKEIKLSSAGAGERSESVVVKTLHLQS